MAEIKDIREVRKKRKRKKLVKSLSFFLVFVLVLTLVIANRDKFAEIDLVTAVHTPLFGGKDKAGFPIMVTQGVPEQVLQKNGSLAILTDSALLGKPVNIRMHMPTPAYVYRIKPKTSCSMTRVAPRFRS